MKVLDAHTHFHDPNWAGGLLWPKPGQDHHRICLPANYRAEIGAGPVVAVETSPRAIDDQRLAEIAHSDAMVLCYVNNLQPLEPGFEQRFEQAQKDPKWRGLRLRPIDAFDLAEPRLIATLARLESKGHIELGVRDPARLASFRKLALALPRVNFVLTHCGHPPLEVDGPERFDPLWDLPNVYVKLSPPQVANFSAPLVRRRLQDHIHLLRQNFGAERLMYGSNWPVCLNPRPFGDWIGAMFSNIPGEAEAIMGGTARALYRIAPADQPVG